MTPTVRPLGPADLHLAYPAMLELRAGRLVMESEAAFVDHVVRHQFPQGYRMLGAFQEGRPHALAVTGYRFLTTLAWGSVLYVDDLVTLPGARGQGLADALFGALLEEARTQGCAQLHLDSGVQRHVAHRFYLKRGMDITCHHFQMPAL